MVTIRSRGKLPHWEDKAAAYFVTFRLGDSLPKTAAEKIEFERRDIVATAKAMQREISAQERKRLADLFSGKIESHLDAGRGACHLANPEVARMVAQTLRVTNRKNSRRDAGVTGKQRAARKGVIGSGAAETSGHPIAYVTMRV